MQLQNVNEGVHNLMEPIIQNQTFQIDSKLQKSPDLKPKLISHT